MIRIAARRWVIKRILMQITSISLKSQGLAIYNYLTTKSIINLKLKRNTERTPTLLLLANMEPFQIPVWSPKCRLKLKPKRIKRPKLAVEPRASSLRSILTPTMNAATTRSSTTTPWTTTLPWSAAHTSSRKKRCSRTTQGWRMQRNWRNVRIKHKFKYSKLPATLPSWAWLIWWATHLYHTTILCTLGQSRIIMEIHQK